MPFRLPERGPRTLKRSICLTSWISVSLFGQFSGVFREAYPGRVTFSHRPPAPQQPSHLRYAARAVLRAGLLLLASGASAYRVKHSMERTAHALGIRTTHAAVSFTEITLTCYGYGDVCTLTGEQRALGVNAARIDALITAIDALPDGSTPARVTSTLDDAIARARTYPAWLLALVSGLACACFCFLNRGGVVECSAVFFAASAGQAARGWLARRLVNHFGIWFLVGALAAVLYLATVGVAEAAWHIAVVHEAGVVSALLFLIPGFPLVTAMLDTIRADFSAGLTRGAYVTMLMLAAGMAVWVVTVLFDTDIAPHAAYVIPEPWLALARAAATFVASYGFAMLFTAEQGAALLAGAIGALVNAARLSAQDAGFYNVAAVFLAALGAGILAHLLTRRTRFSRVSLSVPAVVVMIPGVVFFRGLHAINAGQIAQAAGALTNVVLVICAVGAGVAAARMITDRHWLMEPPHELSPAFDE